MDIGLGLGMLGAIAAVALLVDMSRRAASKGRDNQPDRTPLARLTWALLLALVVLGLAGGCAALWLLTHPAVGS